MYHATASQFRKHAKQLLNNCDDNKINDDNNEFQCNRPHDLVAHISSQLHDDPGYLTLDFGRYLSLSLPMFHIKSLYSVKKFDC